MSVKAHIALTMLAAGWLVSCSPSRFVRPLDEGKTRVHASTGVAPLFFEDRSEFSPIGILFGGASVALGHGFSKNVTVWGAVHPVGLIFGYFSAEIGGVLGIVTPTDQGLGLSVSPMFNMMVSSGKSYGGSAGILAPQIDANVYYETRSLRPYVGVANYFGLFSDLSYVPVMQAGITFKARTTSITFEAKVPMISDRNGDLSPQTAGFSFSFAGH